MAEWSGVRRPPTDTVRRFVMSLCGTLLAGAGPRVIHEFCDHYELARYDPAQFGRKQYEQLASRHALLLDRSVPRGANACGIHVSLADTSFWSAKKTLLPARQFTNASTNTLVKGSGPSLQ